MSSPKATKPKKQVTKSEKNQSQSVSASSKVTPQLKRSRYASLLSRKRIKPERPVLPGAFRLFGRSLQLLQQRWKLFLGISIVYAVLNLLLVHGLADNENVQNIKTVLDEALEGQGGQLVSGLAVFAYLLGGSDSAGSANANAGVYQTLIIIVVSLATVWALRQVYSNKAAMVRIRDAFYKGMYPFVPFILVLLVVGVQLVPLVVGGVLYGTVVGNGIAVYAIEKLLWALAFFFLALLSLYLITSSVFALYVVTLPDMTPMKALSSARELVRYRRWLVLRKMLFLPLALIVLMALIMLPIILWLTPLAVAIYFALSILSLTIVHSYMYALYRELLR